MPYVYMCIHKETTHFYIGYRENNKIPSTADLPQYKTSSKIVKPDFENYQFLIIAEFLDKESAYDFEQQLIFENWSHPLLLNKQYRLPNGEKKFKSGMKDKKLTAAQKKKLSKIRTGKKKKPLTQEQKEKHRVAQRSEEHTSELQSH